MKYNETNVTTGQLMQTGAKALHHLVIDVIQGPAVLLSLIQQSLPQSRAQGDQTH